MRQRIHSGRLQALQDRGRTNRPDPIESRYSMDENFGRTRMRRQAAVASDQGGKDRDVMVKALRDLGPLPATFDAWRTQSGLSSLAFETGFRKLQEEGKVRQTKKATELHLTHWQPVGEATSPSSNSRI